MTLQGRRLGAAVILLSLMAALGWLAWAVLRDFWVLVIALARP